MNSVPLILPLTLVPSSSGLECPSDAPSYAQILVGEASSVADVSCVTYWRGNSLFFSSGSQFGSSDALDGVVLGCKDGTLYLLRQSRHFTSPPISIEKPLLSRPPSPTPVHLPSRSRSRPRTPTASLTPFSLASRARPEEFCGLDEEPEKLKELLLKGSTRDSASMDRFPPSLDRAGVAEKLAALSKGLSSPSGSVRRSEAKSLLSAVHSPALSIASLPSPTSHSAIPSPSGPLYHLSLESHIFPPRSSSGNAVVGLHALADGRHFICLQSQGDLSIFAVKDGSCVLSLRISELSSVPPLGAKEVKSSAATWAWRKLFVHENGESVVILALATIDEGFAPRSSADSEGISQQPLPRVTIFELRDNIDRGDEELSLDKAAEWLVEGPSAGIGLCTDGDDALKFFHVDTSNHLVVQRIVLVPVAIELQSESPGDNGTLALASLNPFKGNTHTQEHTTSPDDRREGCRILLEDPLDVGELKLDQRLKGIQLRFTSERIRGVVWSDAELYVSDTQPIPAVDALTCPQGLEHDSQQLIMNQLGPAREELNDITWLSWDTYCAIYSDRIEVSRLRLVDPNNDRVLERRSPGILHRHILNSVAIRGAQLLRFLTPSAILSTGISSGGRRQISLHTAIASGESRKEWARTTLWKSYDKGKKTPDDDRRITCMLPLELTHIILGYSIVSQIFPRYSLLTDGHVVGDGTIGRSSFSNLVQLNSKLAPEDVSDIPLNGSVIGLHIAQNDRTGERLIVGGADDGSVAIWSLGSMKTLARWVLFLSPLQHVLHLRYDKGGPLRGCLLCVSGDGTIAVIALDDYDFLYMVPGAPAPLDRICIGGDNLLLLYRDDRARLWDVKTLEFWRSMNLEKAGELLSQGNWTELSFRDSSSVGNAPTTLPVSSPDSSSTILVDPEPFLTRAVSIAKSTAGDETNARERTAGTLRSLIQVLLTPGLNADIDAICRDKLGVPVTHASVGFHRFAAPPHNSGSTLTSVNQKPCKLRIVSENPQSSWCISGDISASRALALIACLRTLAHFESENHPTVPTWPLNPGSDTADYVNTVITFYATSLPYTVGKAYVPPSLSFLAKWWFDVSSTGVLYYLSLLSIYGGAFTAELRLATRTLFDAGVAGLTDEETISMVERWQHSLPFLLPESDRKSLIAAKALLLCGFIAVKQHNLVSKRCRLPVLKRRECSDKVFHFSSALNIISKSIMMYLHESDVSCKALAIDLCSRGFDVWQHYIDAMEMLRSARQAVLHIVTNNTGIFMTTLSLDILHPQSLEHRKSVMQLVAFLIRKKPLIIYPNLPKLVEAVVKSLDPNSTSNRDAVLDTATEILGHVVKTCARLPAEARVHLQSFLRSFPTVDFHMASQRLAVGTAEGAIVMYDLKTATRLYVLECHKQALTAAVSHLMVGDCFFYPGAPPRQGHGGSEPFKSLNFNVGDAGEVFPFVRGASSFEHCQSGNSLSIAMMVLEETLEHLRFEWTAERSVQLKIRDVTLTFST
ncbi:hypothetical protein B0F90DRAFT_1818820 [Multifurca ochricompacta]|uniref:Uncharacterized protein n=1 Tax=Multifurca ochricompacta TaxID=376703 RepID=A0AAD4QM83_9AGAM|nr:hypothetical protein B0F90DRAFT_1818820 [Multifurca ochricompacta]